MAKRQVRPRRGDLEAATEPHPAVPSGEFAGPANVEICDLCGCAITNRGVHPARDALAEGGEHRG